MRLALSKLKKVRGVADVPEAIPHSWVNPPVDWIKINVDGAARSDDGRSRVGCAARGHKGEWLIGEARSMALMSSTTAKLWAIYCGLWLA